VTLILMIMKIVNRQKSKSKEKIDGAVAGVMAKAAHLSVKEQENVYENRGMRML